METKHTIVDVDADEVVLGLPSILTLLEKAWRSITLIFPHLWWAVAIVAILQLPLVLMSEDLESGIYESTELIVLLLANIASVLFSIVLIHYIIQLHIDSTTANLSESLRWLGRRVGTVLLLMAIVFGITFTGIFLLLIPALIFAVYNMFSYIVLVREEKRAPVNYIIRSTELVYGAFWSLLGRVVGTLFIFWITLSVVTWLVGQVVTILFGAFPVLVVEVLLFGIFLVIQMVGVVATVSVLLQLYDVRYAQTVDDQSRQLPVKRLRAMYRTAAVIGWLGFFSLTLGLFIMYITSLGLV